MDNIPVLILVSVLSVSALGTIWLTRTRRVTSVNWRAAKLAEFQEIPSDGEAIATWTEEHERQWRASQKTS